MIWCSGFIRWLRRCLRRIIEIADDAPGQVLVRLALEDSVLLSRITRKSAHALNLQPGMTVVAQVKSVAVA
ncbi:MAG: TOBE domain-containing protein [Thiobacillus sp.]|nr:TOBE domain-containing protein [Thiobacillus sp.]